MRRGVRLPRLPGYEVAACPERVAADVDAGRFAFDVPHGTWTISIASGAH
jgi:hypothetical protein